MFKAYLITCHVLRIDLFKKKKQTLISKILSPQPLSPYTPLNHQTPNCLLTPTPSDLMSSTIVDDTRATISSPPCSKVLFFFTLSFNLRVYASNSYMPIFWININMYKKINFFFVVIYLLLLILPLLLLLVVLATFMLLLSISSYCCAFIIIVSLIV